jgi:phage terminase large subunit-like protein
VTKPLANGAADMTRPDRADALVWALTDLLVEPMPGEAILEVYRMRVREAAGQSPPRAPPDTAPPH